MESTVLILLGLCAVGLLGAVVLARGISGRAVLVPPRCVRCGYDLRSIAGTPGAACPECGHDLSHLRAVSYGRPVRRGWLLALGMLIIVVPLITIFVMVIVESRAMPQRMAAARGFGAPAPVPELLDRLKTTTGHHSREWDDLESHLLAGTMTATQINTAIEALIRATANRDRPTSPLSWSEDFFLAADQAGHVSGDQFGRLAEAYFTTPPIVSMRNQTARDDPVPIDVRFGNPWDLPETRTLRALSRVTATSGEFLMFVGRDGDPEIVSSAAMSSMHTRIAADLPPGDHTLMIDMTLGVVSPPQLNGRRFPRGPGLPEAWPETRWRKTWQVEVPLTILPAGSESIITLPPTPERNREFRAILNPGTLQCIQAADKTRLLLNMNSRATPLPFFFKVTAHTGDAVFDLGWVAATGSDGSADQDPSGLLRTPPPPELCAADLIFTPDAEQAATSPHFSKIYGGEIIYRNYPLRRTDLQTKP